MGTYITRNGVEIAEVTEIGGPSIESDVIDVTHLRSPDFFREKIAGIKDGGEVSLALNYVPADPTHDASTGLLSALAGTGVSPQETYVITFPDTTQWTIPGFVSGFEVTSAFDGKIEADVTITVSGKPTLA